MKVLVTGGSGLVGKAIQNIQSEFPQYEFVFLSSKNCNLTDFHDTLECFQKLLPDIIIHLAAVVGGLFMNMENNIRMFEDNILINMNVLRVARICSITRVISCLSTCVFPDQPNTILNESCLHQGEPHPSNYGYAYAKRLLQIHSRLYREEVGYNYSCVFPCNIYGPHDNFHLQNGHVIPALIHKCHIAKTSREPFVVMGSGTPLRQFIYSEDVARLIIMTIPLEITDMILAPHVSQEISIKDTAILISRYFDYVEHLQFDTSKADGQYKKTADNAILRSHFPQYQFTTIEKGLQKTIDWFLFNYPNIRC